MSSTSRDEAVKTLRPNLNLPKSESPIESFQNEVIRPILKFQNNHLIDLTRGYLQKRHKNFNALKVTAQEQVIRQAGKQDPEWRNMMILSVVGLFASEELPLYLEHRSEIHKRISTMAVQRILSQIDLLY